MECAALTPTPHSYAGRGSQESSSQQTGNSHENNALYLPYDTRSNVIRNNILYAGLQNLFIGSWSKKMTANVVNHN